MKFLIQFPVRDRFTKFCSTLDLYINKASGTNEMFFNISIDTTDINITKDKVITYFKKYPKVNYLVSVNDNKSKVEAINRIPKIDFDILLLASDDMEPQVNNYDTIIANQMLKSYPDLDGSLWYPDGYQNRLNTLCILGKKYFDRFGYIYHPSYKSLWCDNEFMKVAQILNRQMYIDQCIIKHEHWANNGKFSKDALYLKNDSYSNIDRDNYYKREKINFGL